MPPKTKIELQTQIDTLLATNGMEEVSAEDVRSVFTDLKDSNVNKSDEANELLPESGTTGHILTKTADGREYAAVPTAAATPFEIHGISAEAIPEGVDKFPFSNEGTTGDPNSYVEWDDIVDSIRNVKVYTKSRPQADADNNLTLAISAITREMDLCVNTPSRSSESTGDWSDITLGAALQIVNGEEDVDTPVLNRYYYGSFRDDFWFVTDVGGGVIRLIQDVADDALASFLTTSTNTVVWLHGLNSDEEALTHLTVLQANHEYFYFNKRSRTIRKLSNSTFTGAGDTANHYQWLPVTDGGVSIIDVTGQGGPLVNAQNYKSLFVDFISGRTWIGQIQPIAAVAASGTFTDYTQQDYLGAFSHSGAAGSPTEYKIYYSFDPNNHGWRRRTEVIAPFTSNYWTWQHVTLEGTSLFGHDDIWLDEADSDAELAASIHGPDPLTHASVSFVGFNRTTSKVKVLTNSTYVAPTDPDIQYHAVLLSGGGELKFRTSLKVLNTTAAPLDRVARRTTLSTPLDQMSNDDDIEFILYGQSTGKYVAAPIRITAGLLKSRVVSTLADEATISGSSISTGDANKYIQSKIPRGNEGNLQGFGHDSLFIGRISNSILVLWTGASTVDGWEYWEINRLQYGGAVSSPAAASTSQQQVETFSGFTREEIVSDESVAVTAYSTSWAQAATGIYLTDAISKDDVRAVSIIVDIQTRFGIAIYLDRNMIDVMGYHSGLFTWSGGSDRIPCAYWSGSNSSTDIRENWRHRPSFFQLDSRRNAEIPSIAVFLRDSGDDLIGVNVIASSNIAMTLRSVEVIHI